MPQIATSAADASAPDRPVRKPQYLEPGPSIILDGVRFLAAVCVAVGHISQGLFTTGWSPILMDVAIGSVAVFFILSGFMIRYVTSVKYGTLRRYAVDRFARIYSVALPAIAITILFDTISAHANFHYYASNFLTSYTAASTHAGITSQIWFRGLVRIIVSLAMLSQSWSQDIAPLSNSPFWSLSYECVYYALFGAIIYLRGAKRALSLVVICLLIGPNILLMFPLWLLGCAAYDAYHEGLTKLRSMAKLVICSLASLAGVHGTFAIVQRFHLSWFKIGRIAPHMDYYAIGTVVVLLPICIAARNLHISEESLFIRSIRRLAAATFPLYLTHFPLLVLAAAVIPYPHAALWAKLLLLAATLTLGIALSSPCDQFKDYLRKTLSPRKA